MTHLRKAMLEELQRRNLSAITTRIYLRSVEEFAQYFKTAPDQLGLEHIRQYQAHLFTDRKLEAVSVAQQLSALRFFFLKTLKRRGWLRTCRFPNGRSACPKSSRGKKSNVSSNPPSVRCIGFGCSFSMPPASGAKN